MRGMQPSIKRRKNWEHVFLCDFTGWVMDELELATVKHETFVSLEKVVELLDDKVLNSPTPTHLGADAKFLIQELAEHLGPFWCVSFFHFY